MTAVAVGNAGTPLKVVIYTDGGARGAPGPASCAAVVLNETGEELITEIGVSLGDATVNVAEWQGLLHGFKAAIDLGATDVDLRTDSEVVVRQFSGQYACRDEKLVPLRAQAIELAERFQSVVVSHVPREKNKHADKITRAVLDGTFVPAVPGAADNAGSTEIVVSFTVRVKADPKAMRARIEAGADPKALRSELAERIKRGLPRALSLGDSIEITRNTGR